MDPDEQRASASRGVKKTERWAVWIPWLKKFLTAPDGRAIQLFDEDGAKAWADRANVPFPVHPQPCNHSCNGHRYVAVPWNDQARSIERTGAT
jgi:hypothetical protein